MIGFIGAGNMATALINGICRLNLVPAKDILVSNPHQNKLDALAERYGVGTTSDNAAVAKEADLLFLCIKPQKLETVASEIKPFVKENTMIVSVIAGKTIATLGGLFDRAGGFIRVMPNTPARIGEGVSAVCADEIAEADQRYDFVLRILEGLGEVVPMEESFLDIAGQVAGASPAWMFMVIEAMADGAVAEGMPRDLAYRLAAAGVAGAGKLALHEGGNPGRLKDAVTSPGGTTIEGVRALEQHAVRSAFTEAVIRACEKAKTL